MSQTEDIDVQAYADDIVMQAKVIERIQEAYTNLQAKFSLLGLEFSTAKCELLSDDPNDYIIDQTNDTIIQAAPYARYLGQNINQDGIAIQNIETKMFGKLLGLLKSYSSLTRRARIRIFQIYMRSKVNHMIPMIALTGDITSLWKIMRSTIFWGVIRS